MALRMPQLAANTDNLNLAATNSSATEKSTGSAFPDLLAKVITQASGNSSTSTTRSAADSVSPAKAPSRNAKQSSLGSVPSRAKTADSPSSSNTQTQPEQAAPLTAFAPANPLVSMGLSAPFSSAASKADEATDASSLFSQQLSVNLAKSGAFGTSSIASDVNSNSSNPAPLQTASAFPTFDDNNDDPSSGELAESGADSSSAVSVPSVEAFAVSKPSTPGNLATALSNGLEPAGVAGKLSTKQPNTNASPIHDPQNTASAQTSLQYSTATVESAQKSAASSSPTHPLTPTISTSANSDSASSASNFGHGSQTSSGNGSAHDTKHDDAASGQPHSLSGAPTQEPLLAPDPISGNGFASVLTAQVAGANAAKPEAASSADFAPVPGDSGDSSPVLTADADRIDAMAGTLPGMLHSAKLVTQIAQSELSVGFQAGEFGNVDIRTSMVRSQVTAEISVEHNELRNLLAVELPHLQTKLGDHLLTTTNVVLSNYTGGGSSGFRHAHQQNANAHANPNQQQQGLQPLTDVTTLAETQVSTSQLDVHM